MAAAMTMVEASQSCISPTRKHDSGCVTGELLAAAESTGGKENGAEMEITIMKRMMRSLPRQEFQRLCSTRYCQAGEKLRNTTLHTRHIAIGVPFALQRVARRIHTRKWTTDLLKMTCQR